MSQSQGAGSGEAGESLVKVDGRTFLIRPLRPEDEPAVVEALRRCHPDDRRMRFFNAIRELPPNLAQLLFHFDPKTVVALAAVEPDVDPRAVAGVVRLSTEPGEEAGEFAVMVRSDLKGEGLGSALMQAILACAAKRGLRQAYGVILAENAAMVQLAKALGASVTRCADEPGLVRATIVLDQTAHVPGEPAAMAGPMGGADRRRP